MIFPEREKVIVYFKGKNGSGILRFNRKEIAAINSYIETKNKVIKKVKRIS